MWAGLTTMGVVSGVSRINIFTESLGPNMRRSNNGMSVSFNTLSPGGMNEKIRVNNTLKKQQHNIRSMNSRSRISHKKSISNRALCFFSIHFS